MKPSEALRKHRIEIRHIVESGHARNPRVFRSALRAQDTELIDLDILVDPTPETRLFDKVPSDTNCGTYSEFRWTC